MDSPIKGDSGYYYSFGNRPTFTPGVGGSDTFQFIFAAEDMFITKRTQSVLNDPLLALTAIGGIQIVTYNNR